ncbi:MAG: transporter substrate-binding domain-containing protein [Dehalococcoidales bacterium]|nr:transporter substrate-binding domain-containing protein [Dehalococcoidales bacterium]
MKKLLIIPLLLVSLCTAGIYSRVLADNGLAVRVGIYDNQPKIFTDDNGNPAGFWPDLVRYIAQKEGWEIEWVHGTWTECMERLERNEIDMMPDVAYTEERDENFDFSQEPVYVSWSRIYSKEGISIDSILDLEGKTVAVLEGSVNFIGPDGIKTLIDAFSVKCTFLVVDSYTRVFELIDMKEVDLGVVSKDFAYQHQTDFNVVETSIIFQPSLLYFAFPPESTLKPLLVTAIDNNIRELKTDGDSIYYQSLKNWIGASPIERPVLPNWLKWMLIGIGVILLVLGGGTFLLKTQINKRTKELRESEEKLRLVLETVPHGLVVLDPEGLIMEANRAALLMGTYNKRDLVGNFYLDFVVKRDHKKAKENLKNALEIGFSPSTEYTLLRKSGEEFQARIYVGLIKDPSGNPTGFVTVIEDITNIKQNEKAK